MTGHLVFLENVMSASTANARFVRWNISEFYLKVGTEDVNNGSNRDSTAQALLNSQRIKALERTVD